MHYFIFASKDSYITEDSPDHIILYPDSTDRNYGGDEIIELKKEFVNSYSTASYNVSRILTQFDYSDISSSIVDGYITDPKFYLRLYEVEGQAELNKTYSLALLPIANDHDWEEGVGKHFDNPKTTDGVTWTDYRSGDDWASTEGGMTSGSRTTGGGTWTTGSNCSQSFVNQSGDIEMDVKRVDMGAEDLVDKTNKFTNDMGLAVKTKKPKKDDDKKKKNEDFIRLKSLVNELLAKNHKL